MKPLPSQIIASIANELETKEFQEFHRCTRFRDNSGIIGDTFSEVDRLRIGLKAILQYLDEKESNAK